MTTSQIAIVFPALLFWIMLIVQYGLWFHAKQVSAAAAAEAVDAAQVPGATPGDGERAARSFVAASGNLDDIRVQVTRTADLAIARVSGVAPQLVPGFSWRVASVSQVPLEAFLPENERFRISEGSAGPNSRMGTP